jgi:hypothetical protein
MAPKRLPLHPTSLPKSEAPSFRDELTTSRQLALPNFESEGEPPIAFTTRLLVATTLPHTDHPGANEFTRSSGFYDLCLLAPRRFGLPFGRYPRLVLVWIITEAIRRKDPHLYLPPTLTQFAYQLGLHPSSGPKGTLAQLREQIKRLVNVSFTCFGNTSPDPRFHLAPAFYGGGVHPIKSYLLWWDDPPPDSSNRSFILLSKDFFEEILAHPVPIFLDVIRKLRSPLEMDVYMWLTWRSVRTSRLQRPESVGWQALKNQFGSDYQEERCFRHHFLRAVKKVLSVYPAIRVKATRDHLLLLPFPPHVPRRLTPPKER